MFKTNPNSRDLKGWSCVCIGIFHESKECLKLLLDHGGDPSLRSSYNKNAWDLAKVCGYKSAYFVLVLLGNGVVFHLTDIGFVCFVLWWFSQDDLDAANKVVRSRAEIRQVLIDFDNKNASKLFGKGSACPTKPGCGMEEGLDENGSPIVMQQEMEKELASGSASTSTSTTIKKGKKGKNSSSGGGTKKEAGVKNKTPVKKGKK